MEKIDYVMVVVSDMSRSIEFYRDKLGFSLQEQGDRWTEFDTGSTRLALHAGGEPAKEKLDLPEYRAGACSLGFEVKDLDRTFRDLSAKGVRFVMAPERRPGEPIRLAVAVDPDGVPLSFAQHDSGR